MLRRRLRELLERPGSIRSLGAHDVLTAMLLADAGFEAVFLGGFGVSASLLGLPDLDFLGLDEMACAVRRVASRIAVPLIADGDTGHGDVHNVVRTVEEIERAGAAGLILEDQVSPKRCGHFEGKRVIPAEEMALKVKAALGARSDPNFVLIARTDAREPEGLAAAIDRASRYAAAGADVVFIEAPRSLAEIEEIARRVTHPKLANMLSFGKTPILGAGELEAMGYKIVVSPIDTLLVTVKAVRELAGAFLRDGHTRSLEGKMATFDEVKRLLGLERFLSLRGKLEDPRGGDHHGPGSSAAQP
jgi:methylisocitrate lyase